MKKDYTINIYDINIVRFEQKLAAKGIKYTAHAIMSGFHGTQFNFGSINKISNSNFKTIQEIMK
jgi:hypothetical protein